MKFLAMISALTLATPVLAMDLTSDTVLGTTAAEISSSLTEMGYEVRKIETEDGKIEAYVVKDGKMAEVYVDPVTGKVNKLETK